MKHTHDTDTTYTWVDDVKARGLGDSLETVLDALEPLGPLGAQFLWLGQPALSLLGWGRVVGDIARALEVPGGIDAIRRRLQVDTDQTIPDSVTTEGLDLDRQ